MHMGKMKIVGARRYSCPKHLRGSKRITLWRPSRIMPHLGLPMTMNCWRSAQLNVMTPSTFGCVAMARAIWWTQLTKRGLVAYTAFGKPHGKKCWMNVWPMPSIMGASIFINLSAVHPATSCASWMCFGNNPSTTMRPPKCSTWIWAINWRGLAVTADPERCEGCAA